MNHIYHLVCWNHSQNDFIAVAKCVHVRGKSGAKSKLSRTMLASGSTAVAE
jgi:hypothetical protein